MIDCSCKVIEDGRLLLLKYSHSASSLSLYIIHEAKQQILSANITQQSLPSGIFSMFLSTTHELYQQLSNATSQVSICIDHASIVLQFEAVSILQEQLKLAFSIPIRRYQPADPNRKSLHHMELQLMESISLRNKRSSLTSEKEVIYEDNYDFLGIEANFEALKHVHEFQQHPSCYYNTQGNVFLELRKKVQLKQEWMVREWDSYTHRFNINLNMFHKDNQTRYDLTFGLALRSAIPALRTNIDANLHRTISITVFNQQIYSQCMDRREALRFQNIVSPQSLQLFVTEQPGKERLQVSRIEMYFNQHKRVNVFGQQVLQQLEQRIRLEDFVPFVCLQRSYLHFSFTELK